jgi:hypothetical protein
VLICSEVEPMSEGADSAPMLMASLFGTVALVEYGANLVNDFDCVRLMLWETKLLLLL